MLNPMIRKLTKILAVMLVMIMTVAMVTACNNKAAETNATTTDTPAATVAPAPVGDTQPEPEPEVKADVPLVAAYGYFNEKFTPFFSETAYDVDVAEMVTLGLMENDRGGNLIFNGIEGETYSYNGVDYFYNGIADLSVKYDEASDSTTYHAKLRNDIVFSDGVPVTIDDLIFTYYVFLDPAYSGNATLFSEDIVGLKNYRTQLSDEALETFGPVSDAIYAAGIDHEWSDGDAWDKETQDAYWAFMEEEWSKACQKIVDVCFNDYADAYAESYFGYTPDQLAADEGLKTAFGMFFWGFADFSDDGVYTSAVTGKTWTLEGGDTPTLKDYFNETWAAYEGDIDAFWGTEDPDESGVSLYDGVRSNGIKLLSAASGDTGGVPNISGIRKINDYELEVLVNGFSASAVYNIFGMYVAPLHYYGDRSQYDYNNNKFGFPFGDLSGVHSKDTKPVGAGPYLFVKYENNTVYFEANPLYWKGEPKTKYIQFKAAPNTEFISGIISGDHDQGNMNGSIEDLAQIKDNNANGEMTGEVITTSMVDNRGYGYIGINAYNVSVNNERGSEASKNLRKALATVLAVHRDTAINSYYGELANAIQYPISNTSWAAPQPTDDGYEIAYSKDIDGNPLYTASMSSDDKYEAARQAALVYLEAAGYTIADGKAVAGPSDVRPTKGGDASYLEFEIWIPGDGVGDHPAFALLTDFKESMAKIGITISINDLTDSAPLFDAMNAEILDMWTAAWQATLNVDLHQTYHGDNVIGKPGSTGSNPYGIDDPELDELIMAARRSDDQSYRKAVLKQAFDLVLDWGVEVPNYQRKNFELFSTERINTETITPMITTNWGWLREVETIEMR